MNSQSEAKTLTIPRFSDILEPPLVALVPTGRVGTKIFQSFLDSHENILVIPGYSLMYLYPHWDSWIAETAGDLTWTRAIDLFCEKHGSVIDSRRVLGLSGLERLGPEGDEHIEINEQSFRTYLEIMLSDEPVSRRTFLLAVHYAYALCKGWDLSSIRVLFYHIHAPYLLEPLSKDFPEYRLLIMVRNPLASVNSAWRANGMSDRAKLNETDRVIGTARLYRLVCHFHFEVLDKIRPYISDDNVSVLTLESLHLQHEATMRLVAQWLGVDFSPSMLESTFDGKLWWGDYSNETPINGLDPEAMVPKWGISIDRTDAFVIEGILLHLLDGYDYDKAAYRRDTKLNRLMLRLAILLPSKVERKTIGSYLNPLMHFRFLRAALYESTGRLPRKDYTSNATYRFKVNYGGQQRWRTQWYIRYLESAEQRGHDRQRRWTNQVFLASGRVTYVLSQYVRFWAAAITFPMEIFRRWRICYAGLRTRVHGRSFLPKQLH